MLTITTIKQQLMPIFERYGVDKAYLHNKTGAKDIDLRIESESIRDLFTLSGFRQDAQEALGANVEVVDGLPDSPDIRRNREKNEVLIYESRSAG